MTAVDDARAALAELDRRVVDAESACRDADAAFRTAPSPKSHSASAVATQILANLHVDLESAKKAVDEAGRGELTEKLSAAVTRAQTAALFAAAEPLMARACALHADLAAIAAELTALCTAQARASREATELARSLGIHAPVPKPVQPELLKMIVGVRLARAAYQMGAKWLRGFEPSSWIELRPAPPSGDPSADLWKAARKIALPEGDDFLPGPSRDAGPYEAREFYHLRG